MALQTHLKSTEADLNITLLSPLSTDAIGCPADSADDTSNSTALLARGNSMIATQMGRQGAFLFRHRSYFPILLGVPMTIAVLRLQQFHEVTMADEWWAIACLGMSILGFLVRAGTVGFVPGGTSGRNVKMQRANVLNTTGTYSVVRHPLYVGNFLIWAGIVMSFSDLATTLLFVCMYGLYYERIAAAEEEFLADKFGIDYIAWAEVTPAIIPCRSLWQPSSLSFSLRTVLRREYCGLLGIGIGFAAVDFGKHLIMEDRYHICVGWQVVLSVSCGAFFLLRFLKKRTKLLDVALR